MVEILAFLLLPFLSDIATWMKVLYGLGFCLASLVVVTVGIKVVYTLLGDTDRNTAPQMNQSVAADGGSSPVSAIQSGRDTIVNLARGTPPQAALAYLATLFAEGDDLFQRQFVDDEALEQWVSDANKWLIKVTDKLKSDFSAADAVLFERINDKQGMRFRYHHSYNSNHDGKLGALKLHLGNLRQIIDRYSGNP